MKIETTTHKMGQKKCEHICVYIGEFYHAVIFLTTQCSYVPCEEVLFPNKKVMFPRKEVLYPEVQLLFVKE